MHALIALGSNLGPRRGTLERACAALNRLPGTRVLRRSRWIESAPESAGDGGPYLNGAALLETQRSPEELLSDLLALERRFGRSRRRRPRTLDLDLILCGGAVRSSAQLTLPHPRYRGRPFVLGPALEIAPWLRDPLAQRPLRALPAS